MSTVHIDGGGGGPVLLALFDLFSIQRHKPLAFLNISGLKYGAKSNIYIVDQSSSVFCF